MKKSLLATTLIACMATGASASTTYNVTSNITGVQLWLSTTNLISVEYDGSFTGFAITGTATDEDDNGSIDSSNLTLAGAVFFTGGDLPPANLNFDFTDGHYAAGSGVTFTAGGIAGFIFGSEDDAEDTPLPTHILGYHSLLMMSPRLSRYSSRELRVPTRTMPHILTLDSPHPHRPLQVCYLHRAPLPYPASGMAW